jgi:hypothetical protein
VENLLRLPRPNAKRLRDLARSRRERDRNRHRKLLRLPNGAPLWRCRVYAQRLFDLGPRNLEDFLERLVDGRLSTAAEIVDRLERDATSSIDGAAMKAIGGFELPSQFFDMTWVIEMDRRRALAEAGDPQTRAELIALDPKWAEKFAQRDEETAEDAAQ